MSFAKGNFFDDNEDIAWQINHRIDFNSLYAHVGPKEREALSVNSADEYRDTWLSILSTMGSYAGDQLYNNALKVAKEDLKLENGEVIFPKSIKENIESYKSIGGPPLSINHTYGGLSAPPAIEYFLIELIARTCPSTLLNVLWYGSVAQIIEKFASEELKARYIPLIAEGKVSGSMSLTEPDVGSDLANVRSYGEEQADGTWRVTGAKQFISNGCGEISLVLAKNAKGASGLRSLNLYLCPRTIDGKANFKVVKTEEKPGLHGSATCALEFDQSVGYLLGKNGEGFLYMLHLMNEARVAVAFQGLGQMEACLREAKKFAAERKAFGVPIERHALIAERLLDMEVETKAMRSISFQAAFYHSKVELVARQLKDRVIDEKLKRSLEKEMAQYNKKLRDLTPLIKWLAGERSFVMARECLQIHGGYGFSTEYRPEWFVRESLILSIYEGTSQIQALMCLKDTLKQVMRDPKGFAEPALGVGLKGVSEADPLKRKVYKMRQTFNGALLSVLFKLVKENTRAHYSAHKESDILSLIKALGAELLNFENMTPALMHAERITEMKAIVNQARCLVWDAKVDPKRTYIAERFMHKYQNQLDRLNADIDMDDPVLLNRLALLSL